MGERVEIAFRRAADRLIRPGAAVVAAVSGGSDSMALLHLLLRRAPAAGGPVTVAHLDHALRRGSVSDRRFVEASARSLGVPCVARRVAVAEHRRKGESLEEAARRIRRRFLRDVAGEVDADAIALGHTLDDQAETVLLRLLRGAGPSALAAMAERGPGPFVRPLLRLERADVRSFLERRGVTWREDPTNRDVRFDRNRLRLRILPVLQEWANPRAARSLVRAADRLREDADYLDDVARRRFARWTASPASGRIAIAAHRLDGAPRALAGRVARLALRAAGVPDKSVSHRIVEAVLDLARPGNGRAVDLPGGIRARRVGERIELHRRHKRGLVR